MGSETSTCTPLPTSPAAPAFEALALRPFDIENGIWRIWWASTAGGGELDAPLAGRFRDGVGVLECDDVVTGRKLRVRFDWSEITASSARWQQSFSFDGETWQPNWIMESRRSDRLLGWPKHQGRVARCHA
jgi:hypothetical protein